VGSVAMKAEPQILVGIFEDIAWVRVRGRGTFQISPALRRFAEYLLEEKKDRIIVDLEDCTGMDSTFMGTLTGIALLLKDRPTSTFQVINADDKNLESLRTLGLDRVFDVDVEGLSWRHERALVDENVSHALEQPELGPEERRRFIAEAHQALCEANKENVSQFQDVLDFLDQRGQD